MLKKIALILFIFSALESVATPIYASNLFLEITSDIRGVDEIIGNYIDLDNGNNNNGNSISEDKNDNITLRPTFRFGYKRQYILSEQLSVSSSFILSNVYSKAYYPEGATFGGVNFVDPIHLTLSSWDFALEQSVEFVPADAWVLGALVSLKRQFVKLDTLFGAWHLSDSVVANRLEGSIWVDRSISPSDQTVLRFQTTKGKGNTRVSLSLRHYFK